MSVFTHNHPFYTTHNNDFGSFGSLFRFIDDWDKTAREESGRNGQGQGSRQSRRPAQTFTPRFDVKETEQNYELHGELPGVNKKDVEIDFSDPQTIVIRGNVERTYTAGTPPAGLLGDSTTNTITNEPHSEDNAETRSNKSFQPTVEDEKDEKKEGENNTVTTTKSAEGTETPKTEEQQPKHKYWVYERSVGNFSRSFTFSRRVDHENVSASLDNGILTVVVPKAKKHESRPIAIN
ncbi:30 kDa heat shock protein [Xylaria arbuscula]|nr:30 kDa heat shock protein [Xylaria arbuscula]